MPEFLVTKTSSLALRGPVRHPASLAGVLTPRTSLGERGYFESGLGSRSSGGWMEPSRFHQRRHWSTATRMPAGVLIASYPGPSVLCTSLSFMNARDQINEHGHGRPGVVVPYGECDRPLLQVLAWGQRKAGSQHIQDAPGGGCQAPSRRQFALRRSRRRAPTPAHCNSPPGPGKTKVPQMRIPAP